MFGRAYEYKKKMLRIFQGVDNIHLCLSSWQDKLSAL